MASAPITDADRVAPVFLVKGGDPVLVGDAVVRLVDSLVGDQDRSLMVEELDASRWDTDRGDRTIAPLVDAAQTPPFLTDRRIVVGRQLGAFTKADDVGPLLDYLAQPLDTTSLVLVWEPHPNGQIKSGAAPKKVLDGVKKAGGLVVDTSAGARAPQRAEWLDEQLAQAGLRLTPAARKRLLAWAGEEPGKITGVLATLSGAAGADAKVDVGDLEPFLGTEGDATPWVLTDALDAGDVDTALAALQRMLGAGRHPLAIMATLQNHYGRMLALDGADVSGDKQAAELLGIAAGKSTYPAKKALDAGLRLGSARVREFIGLLARADLDLRGAKAWPGDLVMDVLVARLASRSRR
jgi:DNA polymerase-3 subunit delta